MQITRGIGKTNAKTLADYILKNFGPMSHLKLQKLLYYCESYHLAYFNTSLIDENFEAWVHGPVCREVFNLLRDNLLYSDISFDNKSNPDDDINKILNSDQIQLLRDILGELATWSNFELENATHNDEPWKEARNGCSSGEICDTIISKSTMRDYYKGELNVR